MREIKFRLWSMNTMCDPEEVAGWRHSYLFRLFKEYTLLQYTGLKDKNGKEIYEGDIIRFTYWEHLMPPSPNVFIGEVIFELGAFKIKRNNIVHDFFSRTGTTLVFTVLGNIYENPELLESKENV